MLKLNFPLVKEWFEVDGDNTKLLEYDLDQNSKILDLGGYSGVWIDKMIDKYDPFVYVIEPVDYFYNHLNIRFSSNPKFKSLNVGVAKESHDGIIYLDNDSTSMHVKNGNAKKVRFETIENILESFELDEVDLLQINIEGEEYELLETLISNGMLSKFKNIQVQFHMGMQDYDQRRKNIQTGLIKNGFTLLFEYPFIWEGWGKK
jgi:FkbM family methyltransferase